MEKTENFQAKRRELPRDHLNIELPYCHTMAVYKFQVSWIFRHKIQRTKITAKLKNDQGLKFHLEMFLWKPIDSASESLFVQQPFNFLCQICARTFGREDFGKSEGLSQGRCRSFFCLTEPNHFAGGTFWCFCLSAQVFHRLYFHSRDTLGKSKQFVEILKRAEWLQVGLFLSKSTDSQQGNHMKNLKLLLFLLFRKN